MIRFLGFILFLSFLVIINSMEYIIIWERDLSPFISIMLKSFGIMYMIFAFLGGICLMMGGKTPDE